MSSSERQRAADAWNHYCELLKVAGQQLLRQDFPTDDLDLAEGLRYLSRLTFASIERNIEGADPARPLLYELCNERIKVGGDNPDNRYFAAAVDSRYRYVLRGDFRRCSYYSIVTTGRGDGSNNVVCGSLNSSSAIVGADGITEVHISSMPADQNHVALDERATLVICRCTVETPGDREIEISLERSDGTAGYEPLQLDTVARGLDGAAKFVTNASRFYADWTARFQKHVNQLPIYPDQNQLVALGGDPNIQIYLSSWQLRPDECLLITIDSIPACTTWNFQLCNVWFESLDYTVAQIHVNSRTAVYDAAGGVTLCIAAANPRLPNWLQTLGHDHGTMCLRLVGAVRPLVATTRVVRSHELQGTAPRTYE